MEVSIHALLCCAAVELIQDTTGDQERDSTVWTEGVQRVDEDS